jgi:hypothetical protein
MEFLAAALAVVLGLVPIVIGRFIFPGVRATGGAAPAIGRWAIFGGLFVCEAVGVLASFFLINQAFKLTTRALLIASIVALLVFSGTFALRPNKSEFNPQDIPLYFKDGFVWPAAFPALAAALGVPPSLFLQPTPSPSATASLLINLLSLWQ